MKKLFLNLLLLPIVVSSIFFIDSCTDNQKNSSTENSIFPEGYEKNVGVVLSLVEKYEIDFKTPVDAIKSNIEINPAITAVIRTISATKEFPSDATTLLTIMSLASKPIMTKDSNFYCFGGFEFSFENNLSVKNKPITDKESIDLSYSENNIGLFGFDNFNFVSLKQKIVSTTDEEKIKTGDDFIGSAFIDGILNSNNKIKGVEITGNESLAKTDVTLYYFSLELSFNENVTLLDFASLFLAGFGIDVSEIDGIPVGFSLPTVSSVLAKINCNVSVVKVTDLSLTVHE